MNEETQEDIIADIVSGATEDITDTGEQPVSEGEATTPAEDVVIQPEEIKIPENWEQPIKSFFDNEIFKDNLEAKRTFFDKFKSIDDGYQSKFQTLADQRKEFEALQESFNSNQDLFKSYKGVDDFILPEHKRNLDLAGKSVPQYLKEVYELDRMASSSPEGALRVIDNIMKIHGMGIDDLSKGYNNPEFARKRAQMDSQRSTEQLEEKLMKKVREEFEAQQAQRKAQELFTAKDEAGNLKYPHLDKIEGDVAMLMETKKINIDEAYKLAKLLNPAVFTEELQAQAKIKAVQEENERAKVIKGAKSSPKSANATNKHLTQDDIILEIMKENGRDPEQ